MRFACVLQGLTFLRRPAISLGAGAAHQHGPLAVVNYEQAVEPFLETDRLSDSERAMLMGGACAKAYRWTPKKS